MKTTLKQYGPFALWLLACFTAAGLALLMPGCASDQVAPPSLNLQTGTIATTQQGALLTGAQADVQNASVGVAKAIQQLKGQ